MSAPYKIESDVPLPVIRGENGSTGLLRSMKAGESFFEATENKVGRQQRWSQIARQAKIKIATRSVEGGIRVWRVE